MPPAEWARGAAGGGGSCRVYFDSVSLIELGRQLHYQRHLSSNGSGGLAQAGDFGQPPDYVAAGRRCERGGDSFCKTNDRLVYVYQCGHGDLSSAVVLFPFFLVAIQCVGGIGRDCPRVAIVGFCVVWFGLSDFFFFCVVG